LSWEYEKTIPSGIVVGVDGSPESTAAYNSAAMIARTRHCALHVVSVLAPFPTYHLDPSHAKSDQNVDELRVQLRDSSLRQIMHAGDADASWTREVALGRPARMLTTIAADRGAEMIVLGRRAHGIVDRIAGGETTLQVMRLAETPVMAVSSPLNSLDRIVVATDFSPASVRAARIALNLLGATGALHLVYVAPPVEFLPGGFTLLDDSDSPTDVATRFRGLVQSLHPPVGVVVDTAVLHGKPVRAVVEFAESAGADMIATGTHGHTPLEKFFLGSVSTGVVRNAGCAVLVVPAG
jgi:nucleotide-binding universal stress UspA family protein